MQNLKTFQILNQLLSFYTSLPITAQTLDSFLTIEIVKDSLVEERDFGLGRAEGALLRKIGAYREVNEKSGKQELFCGVFDVFAVHQYGGCYVGLDKSGLIGNLMKNVDNIMVMHQNGTFQTNILHYQPSQTPITSPILLLSISETKTCKPSPTPQQKSKFHNHLLSQLQKYSTICDLFHGHINLRLCLYQQSECLELRDKFGKEKLMRLLRVGVEMRGSQDELDILLRDEIPHSAYIRVVKQCGNKVSKGDFGGSPEMYRMLCCQQGKFYTFQILDNEPYQSYDQFLIWFLSNGKPILTLLPPLEASKNKNRRKRRYGLGNDKFVEKRSILGCTEIQMEEKIGLDGGRKLYSESSKDKGNIKDEGLDDGESLCCFNSEAGSQEPMPVSQPVKNIPTIIINFIAQLPEPQQKRIIQQQLDSILAYLLKTRKQQHQNIQIHRNLSLINKLTQLLQVSQENVQQIVFLNKL